jgi:hypothetical protein
VRPYLKKKKSQKRAGGVAQGIHPKFKPQYCQKKNQIVKSVSINTVHLDLEIVSIFEYKSCLYLNIRAACIINKLFL